MDPRNDDLQYWMDRVQDYVDGSMPRRDAVQFYLLTQKEPALAAELEAHRALIAALEEQPVEAPGAGFDARILASVPYDRYREGPRRPESVLVIGDASEPVWVRATRPLRRGVGAALVAYALVLIVGNSFLAETADRAARSVAAQFDRWVEASSGVPVLSSLVAGIDAAYDFAIGGLASLSGAVGSGLVTFLLGMAVAGALLAGIAAARRRQEIHRERA